MKRWVAAAAAVPQQPPSKTLQLIDSTQQANFASGSDQLTADARAKLDVFAAALRGTHPRRVLVTAHTDSQRLVRAARAHFGTNQRLSEARAARVVEYLQDRARFARRRLRDSRLRRQPGRIADNRAAAGRARNRRAKGSVWVEKAAPAGHRQRPLLGAPPTLAAVSSCVGDAADQLAPLRITVDGVPLDRREGANEADRQRCRDVALARADIQVRYDPLEQKPFLNAIAIPQLGVVGKPVRFTTYWNYSHYIAHAEVRLFAADQSVQQRPIAVIPVRVGGSRAQWVQP